MDRVNPHYSFFTTNIVAWLEQCEGASFVMLLGRFTGVGTVPHAVSQKTDHIPLPGGLAHEARGYIIRMPIIRPITGCGRLGPRVLCKSSSSCLSRCTSSCQSQPGFACLEFLQMCCQPGVSAHLPACKCAGSSRDVRCQGCQYILEILWDVRGLRAKAKVPQLNANKV